MANTDFTKYQTDVCEETPDAKPLKEFCPTCVPDPNYMEPDWTMMVGEPYLNEKTCEYSVCVTMDKNMMSFVLGEDGPFPEGNARRQLLRRYIEPALILMLEEYGKLVADQVLCAFHEGPTLTAMKPEDLIANSSNLTTIFESLSTDPETGRCVDLEVPAQNIPDPLLPDQPVDILQTTSNIVANLPTIKNPFALELYAYAKEFMIDPYQGLLKVLVVIPAYIFEAVPDRPSLGDLEDKALETKQEVELDIGALFAQIYRLRTAMSVYSKYQSYFDESQNGQLSLTRDGEKVSSYYASTYAGKVKVFYNELKTLAKKNGWNIRSNTPSATKQNARLVKITFDGSDNENPYVISKIEAKKKGCQYEEFTKGLGKNNEDGFFFKYSNDPTLMNYIAKIKEIDLALQARQSYPWLEFLIKFTFPLIKVDYGTLNKETIEDTVGSCVANNAKKFSLDLNDYMLKEVLSLGEILSYEYNKKGCSQLADFSNEPEVMEFEKNLDAGIEARRDTKENILEAQQQELDRILSDLRAEQNKLVVLEQEKQVYAQEQSPDNTTFVNLRRINKELDKTNSKIERLQKQAIDLNDFDAQDQRQLQRKAARDARKTRRNSHPYTKMARKLALEELKSQNSILTSLVDFDSWVESGYKGLSFSTIDKDMDRKTLMQRMSTCNIQGLATQALRCLLSGTTEKAALKKIVQVALEQMDIDVMGIFISNLPPQEQQKLRDAFKKEFGDLKLPWEEGYDSGSMDNTNAYMNYLTRSNVQKEKQQEQDRERIAVLEEQIKKEKLEQLRQTLSESSDAAEVEEFFSDVHEEEDLFAEFVEENRASDIQEAEAEISELSKQFSDLSEEQQQDVIEGSKKPKHKPGTYGKALGNMQKLIVDAYIQNMIKLLELDSLLSILERFPGGDLLPRILNKTDCSNQGMFNPPLDSFLSTFSLQTCGDLGVGIGVPELLGKKLSNFYDRSLLTKLRNKFIEKVEKSLTGVITKILMKVLQTIDEAICKSIQAAGSLASNSGGLDDAFRDAFCPDGNEEDLDDTKNNLFKAAGLQPSTPSQIPNINQQPVSNDSYECLFKAINSTTSKREVLGLLSTTPSEMDETVLRRIAELTNAMCPEFSSVFGTTNQVAQVFASVANYIPPELRSAIKDQVNAQPDGPIFSSVCLTQEQKNQWDQDRVNLLTDGGLDQSTAERMINEANDRVLDDLGDLSKISEKGPEGLLEEAVASLFREPECSEDNAPISFENEELAAQKKGYIKNFFELIEKRFLGDLIRGRNSVLGNILRDKNNFRLPKHELRTSYPLIWPDYSDSDETWQFRKDNANLLITSRMDGAFGVFPETVGIRMRKQLLEQNPTYNSSPTLPQINMNFVDREEDQEYEFKINYQVLHETGSLKRVSVDETFYRKLRKKEAEQLGLDPSELGDNKTVVTGSTDIIVRSPIDLSKYAVEYTDNTLPYQSYIFKSLLENKIGSDVHDNGSLSSVYSSINSTVLGFTKTAAAGKVDGDIPSGFKFGYTDQTPLSFVDLHYVNPDADPEDKSTWVYTHLPNEKVLGKSATENPRVHFLDPSIHGGSYLLPKIYIEPMTYSGWLGMVKTFIPQIDLCDDVDNGFLNVSEISDRVKQVEDNLPFDERLSLAPDCRVEQPYHKIFAQSSHGMMEGVVLATTKVYATEFILKTLSVFSSVAFSPNNIDSTFISLLVDEMRKGLISQTNRFNIVQGYTYYLLFLEQAAQVVQRQIIDGLMEETPEITAAKAIITEAQENFNPIRINPKAIVDGSYDFSDILDIFQGSAIIGFGEFWEDEYNSIIDIETIDSAGVSAALLARLAFKLGFLTPFKIKLARKVKTLHETKAAAEVLLGALIEKEVQELMKKINFNLRPQPTVHDISKYLLSKNGITLGSSLRSGESVIEQPVVEGETGFDYGRVFDVVRNVETQNPLNELEIEISELPIPAGYNDVYQYLQDSFDPADNMVPEFLESKFRNLLPMLKEGIFYLERYLRVIEKDGTEQVYNIKEFQDILRNRTDLDPDKRISEYYGDAFVVAGTLAGSIGIKFGVRLVYSSISEFEYEIPAGKEQERTYQFPPPELKIKFDDTFYAQVNQLDPVFREELSSYDREMTLSIPEVGNRAIPVVVFEKDVMDMKMSEINLDDDNFGEDLKCYIDKLVLEEEFKILFDYCFPTRSYVSLFGIYSYYGFFESIGKDEENEDETQEDPARLQESWKRRVFNDTKRILRRSFNSTYRTDDDVAEEKQGRDKQKNAKFLKNLLPNSFLNLDSSVKWWQSIRIVDIKPFDPDGEECLSAFQKMFK